MGVLRPTSRIAARSVASSLLLSALAVVASAEGSASPPPPVNATEAPAASNTPSQSQVATEAAGPSNTTELILALAAEPSCPAHPGCAGLAGDCCPDPSGTRLACCIAPPASILGPSSSQLTIASAAGAYVNHYDPRNPLDIHVDPVRSNNYFLILGDWGTAGTPGSCQRAVAQHMKEYVARQSASGKKLLFVASVGDNFYWSGVKQEAWEASWAQPYGVNDPNSPLYNVPWLSVLGNHDYGNDDPYAGCPNKMAGTLANIGGQSYGARQLNRDKNPTRPANTDRFWLPDYNYHYEIPEADLEVIALDTNVRSVPTLGGDWRGNSQAFSTCGGEGEVWNFLARIYQAGQALLRERARVGRASTVLIIQHYPGACQKEVFEAALPPGRKVDVICAYGHVHAQACDGRDVHGQCNMILSGGGGGCCAPEIAQAGFAAVSLDDDRGFRADVSSSEVSMPAGSCHWKRRLRQA